MEIPAIYNNKSIEVISGFSARGKVATKVGILRIQTKGNYLYKLDKSGSTFFFNPDDIENIEHSPLLKIWFNLTQMSPPNNKAGTEEEWLVYTDYLQTSKTWDANQVAIWYALRIKFYNEKTKCNARAVLYQHDLLIKNINEGALIKYDSYFKGCPFWVSDTEIEKLLEN